MYNVINTRQTDNAVYSDEVLKATALIYLSDALLKEEYETCTELVALAKGFGADQADISVVIKELSRGIQTSERPEVKAKKKGRL